MDGPKVIYSQEAEEAVVGAAIINPGVLNETAINADDFYLYKCKVLWKALHALRRAGGQVDYLTLTERLSQNKQLDEIGGQAYLMGLINQTPSSLHAQDYAAIVIDKAKRRRLVNLANAIAQTAWNEGSDLAEKVPGFIEQLANASDVTRGAVPLRDYLSKLYDEVDERANNPVDVWGIPTGISKYDKMTGGLQKGELEILSGEPGVGKSMLAAQRAVTMGQTCPGAIYSLEMTGMAVARRLISGEAMVKTSALKTGHVQDSEWSFITNAFDKLAALPVWMSDCANLNTAQLRADLARLKAQEGIQWFLVDYLYLLRDGDDGDEIAKTTQISGSLKRICRDLELAGTAIHSMNKTGVADNNNGYGDNNNGKAPGNHQLRGSGQVIYNADVVNFLTTYKPNVLSENIKAADQKNIRVLWNTKGREIEDGKKYVLLVQKPGFPRFAEYAPEVP